MAKNSRMKLSPSEKLHSYSKKVWKNGGRGRWEQSRYALQEFGSHLQYKDTQYSTDFILIWKIYVLSVNAV